MGAYEDVERGRLERKLVTRFKGSLARALDNEFYTIKEQRAWDHGHSGYTGTFAEKPGVSIFVLRANLTERQWNTLVGLVVDGLVKWNPKAGEYGKEVPRKPTGPETTLMKKLGITPGNVHHWYQTWNDKWGNAMAFVSPDRRFWIGGLCSS